MQLLALLLALPLLLGAILAEVRRRLPFVVVLLFSMIDFAASWNPHGRVAAMHLPAYVLLMLANGYVLWERVRRPHLWQLGLLFNIPLKVITFSLLQDPDRDLLGPHTRITRSCLRFAPRHCSVTEQPPLLPTQAHSKEEQRNREKAGRREKHRERMECFQIKEESFTKQELAYLSQLKPTPFIWFHPHSDRPGCSPILTTAKPCINPQGQVSQVKAQRTYPAGSPNPVRLRPLAQALLCTHLCSHSIPSRSYQTASSPSSCPSKSCSSSSPSPSWYEMARRSRLEVLRAVVLLASLFCVVSPFLGPSSRPPGPGGGGGGGFLVDGAALPPSPAGVAPAAEGGSPLATALFVLGDSTVDCGTNNHLWTLARADRPPYGRDFDTHLPTGRFSNGRIVVDYLALRLGLPFVPPFLGQSGKIEDMIYGVNYASAAAGILYPSGSDLGQHVSLTQQIQQVTDTFQEFALSLGEEAASDLISKSIVYVSIGSNDFIHYYLQNQSMVQSLYLPWEFNQLLATIVKQELLNLYAANVRKVVLMGLPPVGCTPHYLWQHGSQNGECVEEINNLIVEFNFALRYMVYELNQELPDAKIVFCDAFKGSMDILTNRHLYGFETTTHACCGLGKYGGLIMCLMPEMACSNASTHVWWDEFHPTDAVNALLADNVWSGLHTDMCYPMNLQDMVDSKTRISNHGVTGYTSTEGIR